ncbi:unnamed protein product [Amoebophrya sp. A120]|nr:unnamed protein product [Amoebophrya sp. A120]|eukprot:GSA120T00020832001.1
MSRGLHVRSCGVFRRRRARCGGRTSGSVSCGPLMTWGPSLGRLRFRVVWQSQTIAGNYPPPWGAAKAGRIARGRPSVPRRAGLFSKVPRKNESAAAARARAAGTRSMPRRALLPSRGKERQRCGGPSVSFLRPAAPSCCPPHWSAFVAAGPLQCWQGEINLRPFPAFPPLAATSG